MRVIIATDIFGMTSSIKALQKSLTEISIDSIIVDPFHGDIKNFDTEPEAYKTYMDIGGHEQYKKFVEEALEQSNDRIVLIGFSAGASALWRLMADLPSASIIHFFGFYPSQIRNHLNRIPSQDMTLFFPASEKHFDVETVMSRLSNKENIKLIHSKHLHGFMNPESKNYSSAALIKYKKMVLSSLKHKTKLPH